MKGNKAFILFLAAAGMELSWLFAGAALLLSFVGFSPFSLPQVVFAFFAAAALTLWLQQKAWRIIFRLGAHVITFAVLFLWSLYACSFRGYPFLSGEWMGVLLQGQWEPGQGLLWAAVLFLLVLFWGGGVFLGRRKLAYKKITTRFDVGITVFIILFIIVGATGAPAEPSMMLLFPFFLTGMPAIALARNRQGDARGEFLEKYRGSGPVLAFSGAVLLGGSAILFFLLPFLTQAAEAGYAAMQQYGSPMATLLGRIILFLFGYGRQMRRDAPAEESGGGLSLIDPQAVTEGDAAMWEIVFSWASLIVILGLALFIFGWVSWQLWRWLMSGGDKGGKKRGLGELLFLCLEQGQMLWRQLAGRLGKIIGRLRARHGGDGASRYFARLLAWGRWSGMERVRAETPREYGLTLGHRFPGVQAEIDLIVNYYQHEVYGEMSLQKGQKQLLQRAWRSMCSPLLWPGRLYNRFIKIANR